MSSSTYASPPISAPSHTQEALKTLSSGLHLTKPDKSLEDANHVTPERESRPHDDIINLPLTPPL
jgi:hypothetical protein